MLSGSFKRTSLPDAILLPISLRFRLPNPPKSRLVGVLGCLEGVLGMSWDVLGASWNVLERFGAVLERLGASWDVLEPS